tara:strand:+ start:749 stop:1483 length:735 start_codon:yes stop_codon:yes gene_type:complete
MSVDEDTPREGSIVKIKSKLVIPHLICHYDNYPLMTNADKRMVEEYGIIDLIPHDVPEYMYGVVLEEHWVPPIYNGVEKFEIDWAGEYHLKSFDDTKKTDKLFWIYDLETVKMPEDGIIDEHDEMMYRSFIYNTVLKEWERKQFIFKCWYCGEQGCDRMLVWDRLNNVYSDLANNATINNSQRRYIIYQAMMNWCTSMMGRKPLREICKCVIMEVGELFPSEGDENVEECDSSGIIDLTQSDSS